MKREHLRFTPGRFEIVEVSRTGFSKNAFPYVISLISLAYIIGIIFCFRLQNYEFFKIKRY